MTIGDLHIAFELNGMLRFWRGAEEPDELVILDPPRIERPVDPCPMLRILEIDDNPLVGGPPWWLYEPVTASSRRIGKALALHRDTRLLR